MNKTVLIVEDEKDIREMLRISFSMFGYQTEVAANGQEALDKLTQMKSPPCMIFLDIMMPVMSGPQFCARRKEDPRLAEIPIIILTADDHAKRKAADLGVNEGLTKPVSLTDLRAVASKYCDLKSLSS